jgi:nitroreductase
MSTSANTPACIDILSNRRSIRAYRNDPVSDSLLTQLLGMARQAPSGANLQPGTFIRVQGAARERLTLSLTQAFQSGQQEAEDYSYFPDPMASVYRRRQVAAARALYGSLDIERDDRTARDAQFARNFSFFDAPVALLVTIDRDMGTGCYMDLGMALYGLMLAAQAHGLSSCAIGALASYPKLVRNTLGLAGDQAIVCGVALGYADPDAPVNRTVTERASPETYFRVLSE